MGMWLLCYNNIQKISKFRLCYIIGAFKQQIAEYVKFTNSSQKWECNNELQIFNQAEFILLHYIPNLLSISPSESINE